MKFTKEQLIEQAQKNIKVLRDAVEKIPGGSDAAVIHLHLAEIALASLEAEPVMYASSETLAYAKEGEQLLRTLSSPSGDCVIPLYSAPPAPVSVPDFETLRLRFEASERESEHGFNLHKYGIGYADEDTQARFEAWIACRAAMLQGANASLTHEGKNHPEDNLDMVYHSGDATENGNSPVIPDGWQLVPKQITLEMECALSRADSYEIGWRWALAAAPTHSGTNDGWIPCSERMPDRMVDVITSNGVEIGKGGGMAIPGRNGTNMMPLKGE